MLIFNPVYGFSYLQLTIAPLATTVDPISFDISSQVFVFGMISGGPRFDLSALLMASSAVCSHNGGTGGEVRPVWGIMRCDRSSCCCCWEVSPSGSE